MDGDGIHLAPSRFFNSHCFVPFVSCSVSSDCPFLIMACDGVWDVFTDQNAVAFVTRALTEKVREFDILEQPLNAENMVFQEEYRGFFLGSLTARFFRDCAELRSGVWYVRNF